MENPIQQLYRQIQVCRFSLGNIDLRIVIDEVQYAIQLEIIGMFQLPPSMIEYLKQLNEEIEATKQAFIQQNKRNILSSMENLREKLNYDYSRLMKKGSQKNVKIATQLQKIHRRIVLILKQVFKHRFLDFLEVEDSFPLRIKLLYSDIRVTLQQKIQDLQQEKKKKILCRICEQMIEVDNMQQHCEQCKERADQRKNLLKLNITLAEECSKAFEFKHKYVLEQGKRKKEELARKKKQTKKEPGVVQRSLRRANTIIVDEKSGLDKEREAANIIQAMTIIINYTEKVFANNEDNKLNVETLNELLNAEESIDDTTVQKFISQFKNQINDRRDQLMRIQQLEVQESEKIPSSQNFDERKKMFQRSSAMSQKNFKMNQQNGGSSSRILRRNDTIREEEEDGSQTPVMKQSQKNLEQSDQGDGKTEKKMIMSMLGKTRRRDSLMGMTQSQVIGSGRSQGLILKSALQRNNESDDSNKVQQERSMISSDALGSPKQSQFKNMKSSLKSSIRDSIIEACQPKSWKLGIFLEYDRQGVQFR
ncbi:hypothetical protein pb186bvf_018058 [Paramecium bursaria]